MKRMLVIVGDYYHDAELARHSLEKVAEPYVQAGRLQLTYAGVGHCEQELNLAPDLVVLFAGNYMNPQAEPENYWMTERLAERIERYVADGGAWLAWHSGLASYPNDSVYVRMLRGHFLMHPEQHSLVTYTPLSGTDLGRLGEAFSFMDEHYFVDCKEEETNVFLRSSSVEGEAAAGWYHSYGSGRVGCITPAHLSEGLLMPRFIDTMRSLVAWCAKLDT
ncbi:ThuA domain-containing protein [Paenibacillus ihumii]|uniref:ThuA domain-containing protein n=1 Tax=Paenibacillus ihumii TaxID=687436 RepID=UPI0006D8250F|nr:ThuA domain-containing protein [Paenibacillus ihumii]